MKLDIALTLYVVRNKEGQFFRSKGYGGYGKTWVDDINKCRVYSKIGPARSAVTFFANTYPDYGIPDIVELDVTSGTILDETARVQKAMAKKQRDEIKREIWSAEQRVLQAQSELNSAQQRKDKIIEEQETLDALREALKEV